MAFCGFDNIIRRIRATVAYEHDYLPPAIQRFVAFMTDVEKEVDLLKIARIPGPKRYCNQLKGNLIQDKLT